MSLRCPSSHFLGLGRLQGFRWLINDRGYANVDPSSGSESCVYGLIYRLSPSDEHTLDLNEGVPVAYTKELLPVEFWASRGGATPIDMTGRAERRQMLVYIDRTRVRDDRPKEEYIYRMNMGIQDGVRQGIPQDYVDQVLRQFIPIRDNAEVEELARRQALKFEDEE